MVLEVAGRGRAAVTVDVAVVGSLLGLIIAEGGAIAWLMVRVGLLERRWRTYRSVAYTEKTKVFGLAQDIDQCLDEGCQHRKGCPVPSRRKEVKDLLKIRPQA